MIKKYKQIPIVCPECKKKVGTYDGRSTINPVIQCRNCRKMVVYHIDKKKVEVKPLYPRNCSSGVTFR